MVKRSIRISSFLLAIFTFVMILQYAMEKQQTLPLGTTDQFELNIAQASVSKSELVEELNALTDQHNGILVKITIDSEEYESKKDIIWFGSTEPSIEGIVIDNGEIDWLDPSLSGELIPSTDIGIRPLYGTYAMRGSSDFKNEILQWAEKNGLVFSWYLKTPIMKVAYNYLVHNGIGNAIITAFLLLWATLIAWYVNHARARAIRLLGGVDVRRIHLEDTCTIISLILPAMFVAWLAIVGYVVLKSGIRQVVFVVQSTLIVLCLLVLLSGLLSVIISVLARPRVEHLASRKIPLRMFGHLGMVTRIISIILALLIIPSTVISAQILRQLSDEYSLWENLQGNVSLSFGAIDPLETEEMLPVVESFFCDMEDEDNLSLSLVVDQTILLSDEELGGYDHIIITDESWVESFNIGIETDRENGRLTEIDFGELATPLTHFLNAQLPIWTNEGEVQPDGMAFYEFEGDSFLALPPNVGYGGSTVQAKNPLVILVDDPSALLKTKSFLLPAASSGNVIFHDEETLRLALEESPIKEHVISIDTIVDVALEQAQKFSKQAIFYFLACILTFVSLVFTSVMDAQLWAGSNKKRIFTLHTFGMKYGEIICSPFKREMIIAPVTIIVGCFISYSIRHPDVFTLIGVAICIMVLYGLGSFTAYQICTRLAFFQTSRRVG